MAQTNALKTNRGARKAPAAKPVVSAPRQPRAVKTRNALLGALEQLLKTTDFESIAVVEIAAAAGVSVGTVYAHFKDKDAFLTALIELWRARITERLDIARKSDLISEYKAYGGLRPALQDIIAGGYDQVTEDAHIIRAIQLRLRQGDAEEWKAWRKLGAQGYATVALLFDVYASDVRRKDRETAKKVFNFVINACLAERCVYRDRGAYGVASLSKKKFVSELADLAYAYLTAPE